MDQPPAFNDLSFAAQLEGFVGKCQALVPAAAEGTPLSAIAQSLCAALPQPQCSADFLLLRSIVAEFATRAVATTKAGEIADLLPLLYLHPGGRLDEVFVRCMTNVAARSHASAAPASIHALRMERALSMIAARCTEPHLNAAMVASGIRISERGLTSLLRGHGGFRTVLRQARVNAARTLLQHSLCSIKEIAAQVGYSWTSQFDRDFQRECSLTPGQYRLTHARRSPTA